MFHEELLDGVLLHPGFLRLGDIELGQVLVAGDYGYAFEVSFPNQLLLIDEEAFFVKERRQRLARWKILDIVRAEEPLAQ